MWFIVRHGETLHNAKKILQGRCDSLLNLKGIDQIKSITYRMQNIEQNFSKYTLITSPIVRTKHSMQIIMEILGITNTEPIEECLITDTNCGECTDINRKSIEEKYPNLLENKNRDYWNFKYPGGETFDNVYERITEFYEKYKSHENMIIVMHAKGVRFLVNLLSQKMKDEAIEGLIDQNYFYVWDGKEIKKV